MIFVIKKNGIILFAITFLLALAILSYRMTSEETVSSVNDKNKVKIIMLDAGHGGEDPGAVSDFNGIKEKDINLAIVLKVKENLEKEGYKVVLTRSEDKLEYNPELTNIVKKRREDLERRKKMMDDGGADIAVSVHLNKFPQGKYKGAQVFYPPNPFESQKLAVAIQKSLRELVDKTNEREALVKKEPIIILKNAKTTTAIVECGFLSNQEEEAMLGKKEYQDKLSEAISHGIENYFNSK